MAKLETHASRPWYPIVIGLIAMVDYFITLLPMVAVMVTSVLAAPKRWLRLGIFTALGSSAGGILFGMLVRRLGPVTLQKLSPHLMHTQAWHQTEHFIEAHGILTVFVIGVLPLADHPAIAIVSLSRMPMLEIVFAVTFSKLIKFIGFAWIAAHSPKLLKRFKQKPDKIT